MGFKIFKIKINEVAVAFICTTHKQAAGLKGIKNVVSYTSKKKAAGREGPPR